MAARTLRTELARRLPRAAVVAWLVAGITVGTLGFSAAPMRDGGAFPCQGGGCGCKTAEQCWWGCCCSTPGERLAWAERNGVAPPEGFVAVAKADEATRAERSPAGCGSGHAACCGHDHATSAKPACCGTGGKTVAASGPSKKKTRPDGRPTLTAPRCGGLGLTWIAGGEPLALSDPPAGFVPPAVSAVVLASSARYAHADAPPESPPG